MHKQRTYLKLARKCLLEIASLKGQNRKRFEILKKRAEKYIKKAKESN